MDFSPGPLHEHVCLLDTDPPTERVCVCSSRDVLLERSVRDHD